MTTKQDLIQAITDLRNERAQADLAHRKRVGLIQSEIQSFNALVTAWAHGIDDAITAKLIEVPMEGEGFEGFDDLTFAQGVELEIMGTKAVLRPAMREGEVVFNSEGFGEDFVVSKQPPNYIAQDQYVRMVFDESYLYDRMRMSLPTE